jgi:hypothetical protein
MSETMSESEARLIAARRRYELARLIARVLGVLFGLAVVVTMIAILLIIRNTQNQIADCLTPGGDCYARGLYGEQVRQITADNIAKVCAQLKVQCDELPEPPPQPPEETP